MRRRLDRFHIKCSTSVLLVGMCLFPYANAASAQETAAGFIGVVRDESGAVLPGVTITATSSSLQTSSATDVTGTQGEYRLVPLPIGVYTLDYALSGFQTFRHEGVRLSTGVQARLDVVMKVGSLAETVTVAGAAPVVDVTSTATSTHFNSETLELTPTSRNGLISLGAQAPGIKTQTIDVGGGSVGQTIEFKTYGQQWGSTIIIEGLDTTVPDDSGMGGNYHDYFAIDEARVQSISNGPEIASHGVGIIMTMKSGGNNFHGGGSYGYMSPRFESDNLSQELKDLGFTHGNPLTRRTDQSGDLGGPIKLNRLWFFTSGRYRQSGRVQLGGFMPDGSPAEGYTSEVVWNGKVSYQHNPAHRFIFWSEWARKHDRALTVNEFLPWESRGSRVLPVKTWKGEWQATRGNSLMMSLLGGRWGYRDVSENWDRIRTDEAKAAGIPHGFDIFLRPDQSEFADFRPATRDIVTLMRSGTNPGGGVTDFGKYSGKGTVTWYKPGLFLGDHEVKGSFDYSQFWTIRARGSRGEAGDYELIFSNNAPFQISIHNSPLVPLTNLSYTSAYVNDTWTIGRRLTLDLGLRYQKDTPWVPPQCRLAGPFEPGACIDEEIPFQVFNSITPRLYFSYDLTGDTKTVLKGGWGRFAAMRLMEEILVHPFLFQTTTFRWNDLNGNRDYDAGEVNLDPNGPGYVSGGAAGQTLSNPDEQEMKYDQLSLTLERQLAQNFGVRFSSLYLRLFDQSRMLNTKRGPEAYSVPITGPDPGPDGVAQTADDPGTSLTYWEYPASLAGRNNEVFMIANDTSLVETHTAFDLQLVRRLSNGWQFLTSFSATRNDIPLVRSSAGNRFIPAWDPNVEINNSDRTWEWVGKVSGTYLLPWDVSLSGNFIHERGAPQAREVLLRGGTTIPTLVVKAEPLGSIRLPNVNVLDFRLDKSLRLTGSQRLALRFNLYNALNASSVLAWTLRSGSSYLRPTDILKPRIAEFGVQVFVLRHYEAMRRFDGRPMRLAAWSLMTLLAIGGRIAGNGDLPLTQAVKAGDLRKVRSLLDQKIEVNGRSTDGATALLWAVHGNQDDAADLLILAGADVNTSNDYRMTPLSLACTNANPVMVARLLKAGANPDTRIATGEPPVMTCAATGNADAVRALLAHGANVNAAELQNNQTALMWAAAERHPDVVRALMEAGADLRARSRHGFTALHFAAREGDLEITRLLLAAGVDVNIRSDPDASLKGRGPAFDAMRSGGSTPLLVATVRGNIPLARFLLEHGADPNVDSAGFTPLHWASGTFEGDLSNPMFGFGEPMSGIPDRQAKVDLVKALLARSADPNARVVRRLPGFAGGYAEPIGATPFFLASSVADVEIMQLLLDAGADPAQQTESRTSALMAAAGVNRKLSESPVTEEQSIEAVKLLLKLGADAKHTSANGENALFGPAYRGWNKLVQLLVENGANVNAVSKAGITPWLAASGLGDRFGGVLYNPATAELLVRLGADPKLGTPCQAQVKCR